MNTTPTFSYLISSTLLLSLVSGCGSSDNGSNSIGASSSSGSLSTGDENDSEDSSVDSEEGSETEASSSSGSKGNDGADSLDSSAGSENEDAGENEDSGTGSQNSSNSDDSSDESNGDSDSEDSSGREPWSKFDISFADAAGPEPKFEFSYIWISNSAESTVSKIDTLTAVELGRYRTNPESNGNPSRTSVNLLGEAVVANRRGGEASVIKIAPMSEDCVDKSGDDAIQTSSGSDNVLDWGEDECVLWQHDIDREFLVSDNKGGPRAIAWDAHTVMRDGKEVPEPRVWVAWRKHPENIFTVRRLDGSTGELDNEIELKDIDGGRWDHGAYGGVIDGDGSFWLTGTNGLLVRIDSDFEESRYRSNEGTQYGIAVDGEGDIWLAGFDGKIVHFDHASESFESFNVEPAIDHVRGVVVDRFGHAWLTAHDRSGGSARVVRFDTATKRIIDGNIPLPGAASPVGISVDAEDMIWVVASGSHQAFQINRDDYGDIETVEDLVSPYTYSDMTGAMLKLVNRAG